MLRPQRSVLTTRRSGPISNPLLSHLFCSRAFSLSQLLPVILLFRHEWLFPSPVQNEILSRPGFESGLLRPQRSVLSTRRSRPISKLVFQHLLCSRVFSLSEMLPVILLFRHEWLFPSTLQNEILSRPGFEPGLLRPQRSVLATGRSGPIAKLSFLAFILFERFSVISWYQLFCCSAVKGCSHQQCKIKSCSARIRTLATAATTQCPNH